jgi:hypothetical protein
VPRWNRDAYQRRNLGPKSAAQRNFALSLKSASPIDSAESRPNVASEENDPASMLNFHDGYLEMDPISFGIFSIE